MVNSGSLDSADGNRNGKTRCTQAGDAAIGSQSSGSDDAACKSDCSKSADGDLPSDESAIEPTPTKTEINSSMPLDASLKNELPVIDSKSSACCSLPAEKTQSATNSSSSTDNSEDKGKHSRKLLCLYCDRSFVSANLRQKHVERVHSVKSTRRVSARRQNQLSITPCVHCDNLNSSEHTLSDLFQHLVQEHSAKYFGCLSCEERFLTSTHLADHNNCKHFVGDTTLKATFPIVLETDDISDAVLSADNVSQKLTRSKLRNKVEESLDIEDNSSLVNRKKKSKLKELRNKKISVKTSKIAIKRSKRLQQQAKEHESQKKRRDKKSLSTVRPEAISNTKQPEKSKSACVNPYPQFDHFYRVKKITDHSIDNLKISSLTFDDVFDKAFFNRIKCNIEENLLHHIDGKLFKNEESESRISNFEKILTASQEAQNSSTDNYGCEVSLNAITPAPSLSLSSQFGEDFESQIEYGSKPSKKKTQIRNDEVHYKYFTRRKYQASILQQKENRDLSKLDMWTQMIVKDRQERVMNNKKSAKEILEYTSGQEYKNKIKKQELNRILDRRGPFEDLREEQTKKAAFDKLNSSSDSDISEEVFTGVREVLNELLNRVFEVVEEDDSPLEVSSKEIDQREIPAYLDLRRKTSSTQEEIDTSDKIALICSSQETENFELPTNAVRGKNELVELTGEWARSRMYICAACGGKFSNMKYLLEHKSVYHQNVWAQHHEFVGNQSELYRHLCIPGLGKIGIVEDTIPCKQWKRSNSRTCTKCGKQCNSLGELHRHVLECGGDWTWMLARKKCKYRPYGAKSRRKLRGFEPKIHNKRKTEPSEKKTYKKPMDGPRQRPSDADTIQRMLANLPAKRSRRSLISLRDVVFKSRKTNNRAGTQTRPTSKVKRGKTLHNKQQTESGKSSSSQQRANRALRSLNKVLSSRILDLNSSLLVKRKMKVLRNQRLTRNALQTKNHCADVVSSEISMDDSLVGPVSETPQTQKTRKSPKKDTQLEESKDLAGKSTNNKNTSIAKRLLTSHLNLKNFFPIKKNGLRPVQSNPGLDKISTENESSSHSDKKSEYLENFEHKKAKRGGLKGFVRALSLRKRNSHIDECSARTDIKDTSTTDEQVDLKSGTSRKSSTRSKTKQILPSEKTENDNTQVSSSPDDVNTETLSKKRKLQRSFRKVINKVKKIKSEKASNKPVENAEIKSTKEGNQEQPFLEETPLQDDLLPEKVVALSEVKANVQEEDDIAPIAPSLTDFKENPPIPETIFNLTNSEEKSLQAKGELDFDVKQCDITDTTLHNSDLSIMTDNLDIKTSPTLDLDCQTTPVTIDTSLKPKCVALVSPNLKGRMRKPRGLNDCIAMLTSKLQHKDEKISSSLESLFSTSSTTSAEPRTESRSLLDITTAAMRMPESGGIPKITIFTESKSPVVEETALDLTKKSVSTPNLFSNSHDSSEHIENNDKMLLSQKILASTWTSVDDIIQQVVQNNTSYVFNKPKKNLFAVRTKVDDTIDFVVNTSFSWFESKQVSQNKPKYDKKTRRRKHSDDNLITNILFGKDKLIIAPSSNSKNDLDDPLIAKIKENEYKMSHSQQLSENPSPSATSGISSASGTDPLHSSHNMVGQRHETVCRRNSVVEQNIVNPIVPLKRTQKELNKISCEQSNDSGCLQKNVEVKSHTDTEMDVNESSMSDKVNIELKNVVPAEPINTRTRLQISERGSGIRGSRRRESKKSTPAEIQCGSESQKTRSKGTNRRRGKLRKTKSQDEPQKYAIESHIDNYMDFKEISCDAPDTTILNILPDCQNVICTDRNIELTTEHEPVVLENKIIEQTSKLPSDSEDEVPLALIANIDDGRSFQQNNKASNKTLRIAENKKTPILEECKDTNETPELLEAVRNNLCSTESLNDTKDIAETLTTDSLKENVEETVSKRNTLINTEISKGRIPNIKKKKRKRVFFKSKRRLRTKKFSNTEQNNSLNSEENLQEKSDIIIPGLETFRSINLNERSGVETPSGGPELTKLKNARPVDEEGKIPINLLNAQRTRRKSKSSKKLDKIDNDLFKDFSLVINKKTKRIPPTSIVDDSVCDDILDTFAKPFEVNKETEVKHLDVNKDLPLDDSVEEMDMEIEDIPVNTSIIERDDRQMATLSYTEEIPCLTEDATQKSQMAMEEKEALPVKMNTSDHTDILDDLHNADQLNAELIRLLSKQGGKAKPADMNVSDNNKTNMESLSALEDANDEKESKTEQQELFSVSKSLLDNQIEAELDNNLIKLLEDTKHIDDNKYLSSIALKSKNEGSSNSLKSSGLAADQLLTEKCLMNNLERNINVLTINSSEEDPATEPVDPQESRNSVIGSNNDCKHLSANDISFENISVLTDIYSELANLSSFAHDKEVLANVNVMKEIEVLDKPQDIGSKTLGDLENTNELIDIALSKIVNEFEIPLQESTPTMKNALRPSTSYKSTGKIIIEPNTSASDVLHDQSNSVEIIKAATASFVEKSCSEEYIDESFRIKCLTQDNDAKMQSTNEPISDFEGNKMDTTMLTSFDEPVGTFTSAKRITRRDTKGKSLTAPSVKSVEYIHGTREEPGAIEQVATELNACNLYSYNNRSTRQNRQNKTSSNPAPDSGNESSFKKTTPRYISNTLLDDSFVAVEDDITKRKTRGFAKSNNRDNKSCGIIRGSSDKNLDVYQEVYPVHLLSAEHSDKLSSDTNDGAESGKIENRDNKIGSSNEPFENDPARYDRFSENVAEQVMNLNLSGIEKLTEDSGFIEKSLEDSIDKNFDMGSKSNLSKQNNSREDISKHIESTRETSNNKTRTTLSPYDHAETRFVLGTLQSSSRHDDCVKDSSVLETPKKTEDIEFVDNVCPNLGPESSDLPNERTFKEKDVDGEKTQLKQNKNKSKSLRAHTENSNLELDRKAKQIGKFTFRSDDNAIEPSTIDVLESSVARDTETFLMDIGNTNNQESLLSNAAFDGLFFDGSFDLLGRRRSSRNKSLKSSVDLSTQILDPSNLTNSDEIEGSRDKNLQEPQEPRSATNSRKSNAFEMESRNNRLSSDSNNSTSASNSSALFTTESKGRRPRKIINYNEDNLEKRAIKTNIETKTQELKLKKDVVSVKKKKSKKNANNVGETLEKSVVNQNACNSEHDDFNKESTLSEGVNNKIEDGNAHRNSEEFDVEMQIEQVATIDTKRKKKNKQKLINITKKPEINNSFHDDENQRYTTANEYYSEYTWASDIVPIVYKVSEFSEIPKLVVDIHHIDQIDQKLQEHIFQATLDEPDNNIDNQNVILAESCNLLNEAIDAKSSDCTTEVGSDTVKEPIAIQKNVDHKNVIKSIGKNTNSFSKTSVLESADFESNVKSTNKEIEWKDKKSEDESDSNTLTDSKTDPLGHPPNHLSPVKCNKKTKTKRNVSKSDTDVVNDSISIKGGLSKQLEDVESDFQPSVRYNRRSRKNINYNEETLPDTVRSLSDNRITEKKNKRKSDKYLNIPQNVEGVDEKGTNNDANTIIEETVKTFEGDKILPSADFEEVLKMKKVKSHNNKNNIPSTAMQDTITDCQNPIQPTHIKDIFEFEDNTSNEGQDKKNINTFVNTKKKASTLLSDVNAITEKSTKGDYVESVDVLKPILNDKSDIVTEDQDDIKSKSTEKLGTDSMTNLSNLAESDPTNDITKFERPYSERKIKKLKKNNMDIDIANILDSDNDSANRRSPRTRKMLSEKESELPPENITPQEDLPTIPQKDNSVVDNETRRSVQSLFMAGVLEPIPKLASDQNFGFLEDGPEKHSSDSNESLPLLERISDFQNKLAVKDNKRNNLTESHLPRDYNVSTKCTLNNVDSSKDSLPTISFSSSDDLLRIVESSVITADKSSPDHLDNLLHVSRPENTEEINLDASSSITNKKRKMKGDKIANTAFCEDREQSETVPEESKSIGIAHSSYDQPERQYQLAKINIKDLLLSSLAPPDSTYMELEQIQSEPEQIYSELNQVTKNLEDKNTREDNSPQSLTKLAMKPTKMKMKKQKGTRSKYLSLTQNGSQIFDKAAHQDNISRNKRDKTILNKNIHLTALKNVLSSFTKSNANNAFRESDTVFSEIITSSEMDIAPVLDEIDKSLESDDIYDFNEEFHSKSVSTGKHKSTKANSKNESKSCTKHCEDKDQSVEINLGKESGRRTSNRSAKVKALESIHEKALTESQDFEKITLNIPLDIQQKKTRKGSNAPRATGVVETINNEKDSTSGNRNEDAEKDSLFAFEGDVANALHTPTEQDESEFANKMETVNDSFNNIPKDPSKLNENVEPKNCTIQNQDLNQNINSFQELAEKSGNNLIDSDGLELRRSRRGSRKVASYNENDLIDPLVDALENRRSRSSRKDKSAEKPPIRNQTTLDKPKLSSEELFDLLKNSSYENAAVSKPRNSFFDSITETSSNGAYQDITADEFDNVDEKPSNEPARVQDADKIYEFTEESPESSKEIKELFGKKKKPKAGESGGNKVTSELPTYVSNNTSLDLLDTKLTEKGKECDQEKSNYCNICKKSFIRIENLIKHKTTLTHISKLSELEAKEAEEKAKLEKQAIEEQSNSSLKAISALRDEINITDILQQSERSQVSMQKDSSSLLHNNHSLKLVDIISDVLNKPVLETYSHDKQDFSGKGDIRRYKSLGERKSFECESHLQQVNPSVPTSYLPPTLSQTTILENQINLLENIIGNNLENITTSKHETEKSFIDEISSCSIPSNISDLENNSCTIKKTVFNINSENLEANPDVDFIKPTQYEEISEDSSSARVYDDPKQRKTLNRDEELFLECCSLLKSGSEVSNSNYSKKMKRPIDSRTKLDEPELLENKKLKQTAEEAHEYSDNSRTPTPLGDTYDDDASNSNTISSNWHLKSERPLDKNRSFSFEEVKNKEASGMTFGEILTKGLRNQFEYIAKIDHSNRDNFLPYKNVSSDDRRDDSDSSSASKKIATKGARKVYEGLKVSIPTEDLNLDVLNTSPLNKIAEVKSNPSSDENLEQTPAKPRSTRKSKPVKKAQVGSNLLFKVTKKKSSAQLSSPPPPGKQDIYNFEETQDNTDVFIKPTPKEGNSVLQDAKKDGIINSDNESLGYADSIGADAKSVSSVSSISAMSAKKPEVTPENITKKKYKIMGKIFRNAAKSKIDEIDEELRNIPEIPEIDNLELVENYVRSCQRVKSPFMPPPPPPPLEELPKKPKMTEEEMNMLFDQLLGKEVIEPKQEKTNKASAPKSKPEPKNSDAKKKNTKTKTRKRARGNSESSDGEFNINKTTKKRANKKNNQEDSGINLELELKECIGVASRKSQRTCTSGKQNVLVEYWSSDEEAFEAMLENNKVPTKKEDEKKKPEKKKSEISEPPKTSTTSSEVPEKSLDKPARPKPPRRNKAQSAKKKLPRTKDPEASETGVAASNRRKRAAASPLYHWSSSSEDESQSLIEVKPVREEDDEDDRPIQHGWIVCDSPKKLVTMLALTKGKKTDIDSVKEQGKKRNSNTAS